MKLFLICGCSRGASSERNQALHIMRQLRSRGHDVSVFDLSVIPPEKFQDLDSSMLQDKPIARAIELMKGSDAVLVVSDHYSSVVSKVIDITGLKRNTNTNSRSFYVWNNGGINCVIVGASVRRQKVAKELWATLSTYDGNFLDISDILPFGLPKAYHCDPKLETAGPCVV